MKTPPSGLTSTDMWHGARLVRALLLLTAEYAREHTLSDTVLVGALGSAFGTAGAGAARANGHDPVAYEAVLAQHISRVFRAEFVGPTYH